jgi:hypothetical protein
VSRESIIAPVSLAPLGVGTSLWSSTPESAESIITPVSVAPLEVTASVWSSVPESAESIITPVSPGPLSAASASACSVTISSSLTWSGSDVMVAPSKRPVLRHERNGTGRRHTKPVFRPSPTIIHPTARPSPRAERYGWRLPACLANLAV